ncbi:MAG: formylglycine-generating enzyme family protein [Pirellulales bacterium]
MTKPLFRYVVGSFVACVALSAQASAELNGREGIVDSPPAGVRAVKTERGYMVPYSVTIPGTEVSFDMVPIPGGEVSVELIIDDQPRAVAVMVEPRWVAKYEVTWDQYWQFMKLNTAFSRIEQLRAARRTSPEIEKLFESDRRLDLLRKALDTEVQHVDGVTAPTALYDSDTTYESGEEPDLPAVTMTPFAARQFTKWLSAITGSDFRLPSEAEWEHAARAGAETEYSFGDDPEQLAEYAWFTDNADYAAHKPGEKLPNAWGLHDVHGNVAEWVLDTGTTRNSPPAGATLTWETAVTWPSQVSPRVAKGGYWDSDSADCTISARLLSDDELWKDNDPNRPRSPWWFTDPPASGVGFRIIRSLHRIPTELRARVWEIDAEEIRDDVASRLKEGRGKLGPVGPHLPEVLEQLDSDEVKRHLDAN